MTVLRVVRGVSRAPAGRCTPTVPTSEFVYALCCGRVHVPYVSWSGRGYNVCICLKDGPDTSQTTLERPVRTSSRILLHRSPVKVAVPATNRTGLRLPGGGWAVGG